MKQIAKDYDLKLIVITLKNMDRYLKEYDIEKSEVENNSCIIGDDIILGIYEEKEIRIASFFHEIGHTLISKKFYELINNDILLTEYQAWIEGLKVAKKYGYLFTDKTFVYISDSLNTYRV